MHGVVLPCRILLEKTVRKFEIKIYHPKENAYGLLRNFSLKVDVNPFFRVAKKSYRKRYKHPKMSDVKIISHIYKEVANINLGDMCRKFGK
jgi:hypothetical protein